MMGELVSAGTGVAVICGFVRVLFAKDNMDFNLKFWTVASLVCMSISAIAGASMLSIGEWGYAILGGLFAFIFYIVSMALQEKELQDYYLGGGF